MRYPLSIHVKRCMRKRFVTQVREGYFLITLSIDYTLILYRGVYNLKYLLIFLKLIELISIIAS